MTAHGHVGDIVVAYRVLPAWPDYEPHPSKNTDRHAKVLALVRSGLNGMEIGAQLGISRERVRQIWKIETGTPLPTWERYAERRASRESWCRRCAASYPWRQYAAHIKTVAHVAKLFWSYVDRNGAPPEFNPALGPCWSWTGGLTVGYAHFKGLGEYFGHRVSYRLVKGPIAKGLTIDHLCRVTACVNPDHLEAVTHKENVRRGKNGVLRHLHAPRPYKPFCVRGHERTPDSIYPSGACRACGRVRSAAYDARKRARRAA